ncbi:DUF2231 domain-containing protein [Nocardioides sp. T2.26MG-1]|uniref:DUF2231 domain-containing protein n=1 Tax=Nocardioides sp. T2.26MG-1 TaxID=3041166 RepID=UPI0024778367|nr:DUF2231 domain-containing protein [Nocardioides sp. T2.26MG-1]CAI9411967.1 hypothetical protein HIDPHFAB_01650 [Nocardioides sp. T2.26MG-1]
MPSEIFGLPLHPLIVHATAVLVPLAALLVIGVVASPRLRAWAGPLPMALSLVALILTPLSTSSGENLEHQVGESSLVEKHAELGDQLLPFTIALFVLSVAFWWVDRRRTAATDVSTPAHTSDAGTASRMRTLTIVVGVLALVAAVGTSVQVARIGHSGAKAAWSDTGSASG